MSVHYSAGRWDALLLAPPLAFFAYSLVKALRAWWMCRAAARQLISLCRNQAIFIASHSRELRDTATEYARVERAWLSGAASHLDVERARSLLLNAAIGYSKRMDEVDLMRRALAGHAGVDADSVVAEQSGGV